MEEMAENIFSSIQEGGDVNIYISMDQMDWLQIQHVESLPEM